MSYMVNIYVKLIVANKKTIEDVPQHLKEDVNNVLNNLNK